MKKISYDLDYRDRVTNPSMPYGKIIICPDEYLEANLNIAKREAYNGEYKVEEQGDN